MRVVDRERGRDGSSGASGWTEGAVRALRPPVRCARRGCERVFRRCAHTRVRERETLCPDHAEPEPARGTRRSSSSTPDRPTTTPRAPRAGDGGRAPPRSRAASAASSRARTAARAARAIPPPPPRHTPPRRQMPPRPGRPGATARRGGRWRWATSRSGCASGVSATSSSNASTDLRPTRTRGRTGRARGARAAAAASAAIRRRRAGDAAKTTTPRRRAPAPASGPAALRTLRTLRARRFDRTSTELRSTERRFGASRRRRRRARTRRRRAREEEEEDARCLRVRPAEKIRDAARRRLRECFRILVGRTNSATTRRRRATRVRPRVGSVCAR